MKIKRLEIKGFKSFPDKTILEFKPGITAVVGPNGCGKSNVLEAIRWVMGEQRARILRGKKMEDVIFNGSESRKPVGMAEVRLVLSNTDGLSPASMADYDEIMIARRLFRDGDSQYELNNVACRLSDVTDFFLDTGVGKNSYAIIEQGRVDMVVASKPEDRRVLIEEAAGINRYKSRKEAAIKKLEQTQQNLMRISDVISEVKRQSAALKRQASRAERWRKLTDQLRETDLAIHSWKCAERGTEIQQLNQRLDHERLQLAENEAQYAGLSASLEHERLQALETDRKLKDLLEARHEVDVELTSVRGLVERDRAGISQLAERRKNSAGEERALREKLKEDGQRKDALETDRKKFQEEMKAASELLNKAFAEMRTADQSLGVERKRAESLKEETFRTLQEAAQERNRAASLLKRAKEIEVGVQKLEHEKESIAGSLEKDNAERAQLVASIIEAANERTAEIEREKHLAASREELRREISSMRESVARLERELAGAKARLDSLTEMQQDYTGYGEGVRFLMKTKDACPGGALLGPLAEMVDVAPEFQKALTAALGERLSHLVVASPREGVDAANLLKESGAGRSGFLPLSPRTDRHTNNCQLPENIQRLSDLVNVREGCEELGQFLLSRCYLVDDVETAIQLWECDGMFVDLVTRSGEILTRHGEIIGGAQDSRKDEIFDKRREISELQGKTVALEEDLTALKESFQTAESQEQSVSAELDECRRMANELNLKETRLRKDQERLESQIAASQRRLQVVSLEAEALAKERQGVQDDTAKCETKVSELEKRRVELETQKEEATRRADELQAVAREKSRSSGELRVKLAQLEERNRSLDREFHSLSDTLQQHESRLSSLITEISHAAEEEKRFGDELEKSLIREQELLAAHVAQAEEFQTLRKRSDELGGAVKELEERFSDSGKIVRASGDGVHSLEVEAVKLEQTLDGIVEKIIERYRVDPRTVPSPQSLPDDSQLGELRSKIEAMGEVNPAAITESREIEQRLVFLVEQEHDLKKAVESLYATINAINKTTRERFRTAFNSINEQFREIFPFLFRGGEARLELTDEDNLLETGVEIMARPPGKRIQNMDLLSGGEKALTAVALIFSIFLIKPSPFCLLDEVDAPLDDSNLSRFNEMLRKLGDRTQFLIITHNKRSMEEADSLYGVTMEESGVSRVVSVEFVS